MATCGLHALVRVTRPFGTSTRRPTRRDEDDEGSGRDEAGQVDAREGRRGKMKRDSKVEPAAPTLSRRRRYSHAKDQVDIVVENSSVLPSCQGRRPT